MPRCWSPADRGRTQPRASGSARSGTSRLEEAPADAVTGLGALWTMFREYKAIHGPEDARGFRVKAAQAGRAWITYRTA